MTAAAKNTVTSGASRAVQSREKPAADASFARALLAGLTAPDKSVPCRFLYDAAGSQLFEEITELPEYYPTRTEIGILTDNADDIVGRVPDGAVLVEFGSGSSRKTEILLDRLADRIAAYVPIDISAAALAEAEERLKARYRRLDIRSVVGPFHAPLPSIAGAETSRRVGFFPGSTIGNLVRSDAIALLADMRATLGPGGRLLIGADLIKDPSILVPAYDDAAGVTAAFNLNLLKRANRELGTDFDPEQFTHRATWNGDAERMELFLVSRIDQTVNVLGQRIHFAAGERVHTEHSHKYTIASFQEMVRRAGWAAEAAWTDAAQMFSVHMLERADT